MSVKFRFNTLFASYSAEAGHRIGEGGSGTVYKVTDENGATFAIKYLDPRKATKEKRKRFKNEVAFCLRNSHPNIVTLVDYGLALIEGEETPFYVMPYYPSTLRDLMASKIPPEKIERYFSQLLDGVEAAHLNKIWHRDLKPENILFSEIGDAVLVADFGIAHFEEDYLATSLITKSGTRLANFQYCAPEQRMLGREVNHSADIFALGLILNEMFTCEVIQGASYATIGNVVPKYAYLDEIVSKMVAQSPRDRHPSIDAIKQALIGSKNEFVSRQRLQQLTSKVVPTYAIDDPLVINPLQVVEVDFREDQLIFTLSQPVNSKWVGDFRNIGDFTSFHGYEPKLFSFSNKQALIRVPKFQEPDQTMVDLFKDYLLKANAGYTARIRREQREKEAAERKRLEDEIAEESKRRRLQRNLKI